MLNLPMGTRIWLVAGVTDMRNSFQGLAAKVEGTLKESAFSGHLFVFRGKRGHLLKLLWATEDGLCLLAKRLEHGHFVWPLAREGKIFLTPAQLAMLLEGLEWKQPKQRQSLLTVL
jgi:transposase